MSSLRTDRPGRQLRHRSHKSSRPPPKSAFRIYRKALLAEAGQLLDADVVARADNIFFLDFDEVHEAFRSGHNDRELICVAAAPSEPLARSPAPGPHVGG